jgi:hypothetical protein
MIQNQNAYLFLGGGKGEKCVSWEIKKLAKYIMFPTLPILQIMQTFNDSSCQTFDPFQNSSKKQTS